MAQTAAHNRNLRGKAGTSGSLLTLVVMDKVADPGSNTCRDWYFIAEQPAPEPHLAHPEGYAALRIVLVTVPRVGRSCKPFQDGFDGHLLHLTYTHYT
jgi:hypothetical protein